MPADVTPKELGLKMTMATVEVDKVISLADSLAKIVVGKIKKIEAHPNADRLRVVSVDVGGKNISVVCGGSNLTQDHLVAVALIGAKVKWHGNGDLVMIEKSKVRGVESEGMICAVTEIGLAEKFPAKDDHEILDLTVFDITAEVGQPIAEALYLEETIYEIDNKSINNRPDLWGHYGMAREVAAIYGLPLKNYPFEKIKPGKDYSLKVEIKEKTFCPRYQAVVIDNLTVGESPVWLKEKLTAIGQKSINNIVDVTNFVMFDLGQPLHAFSADKIAEKIVVRCAKKEESLKTLDGEEKKLTESDLVIADKSKVIALAGIMGGELSGINNETKKIVIESANFEPVNIRKTANRLNLRTEAAIRYEKSLDPNMTEIALARTVSLLLEICPDAQVVSNVVDENNYKNKNIKLSLLWDFIDSRIGNKLDHNYVVDILRRLGFLVKDKGKVLKVEVPHWRATKDVSINEDIIEEVSRIHGFDNIEPIMPKVDLTFTEENGLRRLEREVKNILATGCGLHEVYNYSFENIEFLKKIGETIDQVKIANPWSEESAYLRKNLVPVLIGQIAKNERFFEQVGIFEVAKIFDRRNKGAKISTNSKNYLPNQDVHLAFALTGEDSFWQAKGVLEHLAESLNFNCSFSEADALPLWCHPRQGQTIFFNKKEVGYLATIHPETKEFFDLKNNTAVVEINLNDVVDFFPAIGKYVPLAKFPRIVLDLAVIVPQNVEWESLRKLCASIDENLTKAVDLLEIYKNDKIKEGYKSVTIRLTFGSDKRTLQNEEAQKILQKVVDQLRKAVGAEVRS